MPRIDPAIESAGRRISACTLAASGHLLTVYDGGDWSIWPDADAFAVAPTEAAALGIVPDVAEPPPNGMRYYVTDGVSVVRAPTKADARVELGKGGYLVALNADLSLCSCSPAGAPRSTIALVLAEARREPQEEKINGRAG
jgi:hypothetical protein